MSRRITGTIWIVVILAAQDQLVVRVGELEARAQRQLIVGIETSHWAQHADRRQVHRIGC